MNQKAADIFRLLRSSPAYFVYSAGLLGLWFFLVVKLKESPRTFSVLFLLLFMNLTINYLKRKYDYKFFYMLRVSIWICLLVVVCNLILRYCSWSPFAFIFISIALFFTRVLFAVKRSSLRVICVNLIIIFIALGVLEAILTWTVSIGNEQGNRIDRTRIIRGKGLGFRNDVLGYVSSKNTLLNWKIQNGQETIYDVYIRTNKDGLRVAPHDLYKDFNLIKKGKSVVFFGCSFVFGIGVNDWETVPYQTELLSDGFLRCYNLAVGGYGPQQMLRKLEIGLDNRLSMEKPDIGIYTALPEHVERVAGNIPYRLWDVHGPRYLLNRNGGAVFSGSFMTTTEESIYRFFQKSELFKKLLPWYRGWRRTEGDRRLFVQVIKQASELFKSKYHGKFYVIYWDVRPDPDAKKIGQMMAAAGLSLILISEIIPDYVKNKDNYEIKDEGHPNALADKKIAEWLVHKFMNEKK